MKKAFLRIDDFPYSGELYAKYGCFRDSWMCRRFTRIVETCRKYKVVPEFMVGSHALTEEGNCIRFDDVMPNTITAMKEAYDCGIININAHGMLHLDKIIYLDKSLIDPMEFVSLDDKSTREHLDHVCAFIMEVFGKKANGFVAPAWGYRHAVTKRIASEYFMYIVDSYDHWLQGACKDFGTVDPDYGFVHFPETYSYGLYGKDTSIVAYWIDVMSSTDTVHIMQHGYRIPGKWKNALSVNPLKAANHLLWGNLSGIFAAARHAELQWSTLEEEAHSILQHSRVS